MVLVLLKEVVQVLDQPMVEVLKQVDKVQAQLQLMEVDLLQVKDQALALLLQETELQQLKVVDLVQQLSMVADKPQDKAQVQAVPMAVQLKLQVVDLLQ